MSRPNWKDAPEWAQWLAQDSLSQGGGAWNWFETLPTLDRGVWMPNDYSQWEGCVEDAQQDEAEIESRPQ